MRRLNFLLSVALTVTLLVAGGVSAQAAPNDNAAILAGVNDYRSQAGVSTVVEDVNLDYLAQYRADEAARTNSLQHDAGFWANALQDEHINSFGEILARNMPATGVSDAWARSGSHYPIMVGQQYTKTGIGFATDAHGNSFAVTILTEPGMVPQTQPAPEVPQAVTATYAAGALQASWTTAAGSPTGHLVTLYSGGQQVATAFVSAPLTTARFASVARGRSYAVSVQAYRSGDGKASLESAQSATVNVPAAAPNAPVAKPIIVRASDLVLYWDEPSANGAALSGYHLRIMRDGNVVEERTVTGAAYTYSPALSGTYSFDVAALNGVGEGEVTISQAASFSLKQVNTAATQSPAINFTPQPTPSILQADSPAMTPVAPVVPVVPVATSPSAPSTVPSVPSAASKPRLNVVPVMTATPMAKINGSSAMNVRWTAAKSSRSKVDRYEVRVKIGGKFKLYLVKASARGLKLKDLHGGKTVRIWTRAHSAAGWGTYSPELKIRIGR